MSGCNLRGTVSNTSKYKSTRVHSRYSILQIFLRNEIWEVILVLVPYIQILVEAGGEIYDQLFFIYTFRGVFLVLIVFVS